jgi:hypothetical protein
VDVGTKCGIIEQSGLVTMDLQGYNVTIDVIVEEMHMGIVYSNVLCGVFVVEEDEGVKHKRK